MAAKSYPEEKRMEALELLKAGSSVAEVSQLMSISGMTIRRWRNEQRQSEKVGYDKTQVNKYLLELAGENDLSAYVGREITKMSLREIITFLRLLGVKGKLTLEQTIRI